MKSMVLVVEHIDNELNHLVNLIVPIPYDDDDDSDNNNNNDDDDEKYKSNNNNNANEMLERELQKSVKDGDLLVLHSNKDQDSSCFVVAASVSVANDDDKNENNHKLVFQINSKFKKFFNQNEFMFTKVERSACKSASVVKFCILSKQRIENVNLEKACNRRLRNLCTVVNGIYIITVLGVDILLKCVDSNPNELITSNTQVEFLCERISNLEEKNKNFPVVVGQAEAFQSIDMIIQGLGRGVSDKVIIPRSLLISAPSGCGKTFALETIKSRYPQHDITSLDCINLVLEGEMGINFDTKINSSSFERLNIILLDNLDILINEKNGKGRIQDYILKLTNWINSLLERIMQHNNILFLSTCTDSLLDQVENLFTFSKTIKFTAPTELERQLILECWIKESTKLCENLAKRTAGFTPANLKSLYRSIKFCFGPNMEISFEEHENHLQQLIDQIKPDCISMFDIKKHTLQQQTREWENEIAGYDDVKKRLDQLLDSQQNQSDIQLPINPISGILLEGPSGCGKTLFARVIAQRKSFKFQYLSIKSSELLSCYLGESERLIRQLFLQAKKQSPCILFIDEIDSIAIKRENSESNLDGFGNRLLATLLNEMDGVGGLDGVLVIAATSRKDDLDPALLRPGRLGCNVHIGLPNLHDRMEIFQFYDSKFQLLLEKHDIQILASTSEGETCAKIKARCTEMAMEKIRKRILNNN